MGDQSLQLILHRLDHISEEFRGLREGVEKAIRISGDDPEMALTRARKVLEYVMRDLFERRYKESPGTKPLENMLHRIIKDGHLPKRLGAYANHIRELGNVGTHVHGEVLTTDDVRRSLEELMGILEWYFDEVRPEAFTTIPKYPETRLISYRRGAKWGFCDSIKNIVIEPEYESVNPFTENLACVREGGKWGFIDREGREIIPVKYDSAGSFTEGLALVRRNDEQFFIDRVGRELVPIERGALVTPFTEGLASIKLNGQWGFIDKAGRQVVSPKYDSASEFHEGLALVEAGGKYGFIDKTGQEIIPLQYDYVQSLVGASCYMLPIQYFSEGLACVELDSEDEDGFVTHRYGFIDKTGHEVIPFRYGCALPFGEGLALVQLKGVKCFIDKTGQEILSIDYDDASSFSEGLAYVEVNDSYGFIDKTGQEIVSVKYDEANCFCEGLAFVGLNRKYGCIDRTGREVIPLKYDWAGGYFREGLALVRVDVNFGYIGVDGTEYFED